MSLKQGIVNVAHTTGEYFGMAEVGDFVLNTTDPSQAVLIGPNNTSIFSITNNVAIGGIRTGLERLHVTQGNAQVDGTVKAWAMTSCNITTPLTTVTDTFTTNSYLQMVSASMIHAHTVSTSNLIVNGAPLTIQNADFISARLVSASNVTASNVVSRLLNVIDGQIVSLNSISINADNIFIKGVPVSSGTDTTITSSNIAANVITSSNVVARDATILNLTTTLMLTAPTASLTTLTSETTSTIDATFQRMTCTSDSVLSNITSCNLMSFRVTTPNLNAYTTQTSNLYSWYGFMECNLEARNVYTSNLQCSGMAVSNAFFIASTVQDAMAINQTSTNATITDTLTALTITASNVSVTNTMTSDIASSRILQGVTTALCNLTVQYCTALTTFTAYQATIMNLTVPNTGLFTCYEGAITNLNSEILAASNITCNKCTLNELVLPTLMTSMVVSSNIFSSNMNATIHNTQTLTTNMLFSSNATINALTCAGNNTYINGALTVGSNVSMNNEVRCVGALYSYSNTILMKDVVCYTNLYIGDTALYRSGNKTFVGIGTEIPTYPLHVKSQFNNVSAFIASGLIAQSNVMIGPDVAFKFTDGQTHLGIGTLTPSYPIHLTTHCNNISLFSAYDIVVYSDHRLKTDVQRVDGALAKMLKLNGYTYRRTDAPEKRMAGVMAQEVLEALPEVVYENEQGYYSVAYGNMAALYIEAFKELYDKVDHLSSQLLQVCQALNIVAP